MNAKAFLVLSRAFFFLGVVIGLALSVIVIWNNVEATSYYFTGVKHPPFTGLRCPVMIAPTEKGIVTAVFNNPTNEEDNFFYRTEISGRAFSTREINDQIAVPPHQAKNIRFTVDANDVDLLFFILVKITILPNSVHHAQEATCGIMVANILRLSGAQASTVALFLSFAGIAIGLGLWQKASLKGDRDRGRVVPTLGFVVLLTLLAAAVGWWAIAIALTVIIVLLMVISVRFAFA